jgi:hypothetical protein
MKSITITINTENAAFSDNPAEVGNILRNLASMADAGRLTRTMDLHLRDSNGNKIGSVMIK